MTKATCCPIDRASIAEVSQRNREVAAEARTKRCAIRKVSAESQPKRRWMVRSGAGKVKRGCGASKLSWNSKGRWMVCSGVGRVARGCGSNE